MLKQRLSMMLVVFITVMQLLYAFGYEPEAHAAAISDNIIDSVSMAVYDKDGHVVTGDVYEQGSKVQLDYTWSLPNGHGYKNGDTFTFTLPEPFKFYNDIPEQPLLSSGGAVGKFKLDKDTHQVVMTLEAIENLLDVRGTLTFQTLFDVQVIHGSTTQIIKVPVNGGEQVFTLRFKPNVASSIEKSGVPNGYNAKRIDWTVDVNKELSDVQNAVVTDPIPAGLNAPVTAAVYELNVNLDGSAVQGVLVPDSHYTVSTAGNLLQVRFTDSPIRTAYRIQYSTAITDQVKSAFVNTATFEGSNQPPVSATSTVAVQHGAALDKSSTRYDAASQTIDWEIKYNYNEKTIAAADAFLTDMFNDSQELVAGSIHIYKVTIATDGSESLGAELPSADYTVTPLAAAGQNGFMLQLHQEITSAYKIKYQTKAKERVLDLDTITNKVTSGTGDSKTAYRGINQVVLVKSVAGTDYAARTVKWKLAINQDSQPMNNVIVTDGFQNKGLHLIPDSLVIYEGDLPMNASDYTVDSSVPVEDGFKITFIKPLNRPITIFCQTEFRMDWLNPNTETFVNNAAISWIDSTGSEHTKHVSAVFEPRNEAKNNGFKSGSYNAALKQITWTVGVNYNSKPLASATVEDMLESGQQLVDGSVAVYNMNLLPNGNPSQGSVVDSTYYSYAIGTDDKLVVTFLQPIGTPYYIQFKTSLEGKLIPSQISNTAVLFDGSEQASKSLSATVNIPNGGEYVTKNGAQNGDRIDWTVLINRGQSTVADAQITDTPSENQLLLPDSFKLYTAQAAADGTIAKGGQLTRDTDYTLVIQTDSNGKQTFLLSFLKPLSTAAVLEYQSLIAARDQDTVSNKIAFSGNNETTVTKDTTKSIVVGVTSGSGTIGGVRGSLTVNKVDQADRQVRLSGATFELYRISGLEKLLLSSLTTDATGAVVFNGLPVGDYVVKETKAPAGYVLDTSEYAVKIQSEDGFQLTVTNAKSNTPNPPDSNTASLTVKKVSSSSNAILLSGATFELYKKTGAELTPVATKTTDATGTAVFSSLAAGDYILKETAAPTGYILDSKEVPVTIQASASAELTVENKKKSTGGGGSGGSDDSDGSGESNPSTPTTPPTPTSPTSPSSPATPTTPTNPAAPGTPTSPAAPAAPETGEPASPQDNSIEGNVKVPLGDLPDASKQPEQGEAASPTDLKAADDENHQETLPQTGESSPVYIELAGLMLILAGILLKKSFGRKA